MRTLGASKHMPPGVSSYSRKLKIDSNCWCSPGVRMSVSLPGNVVITLTCCLLNHAFQYYLFVLVCLNFYKLLYDDI